MFEIRDLDILREIDILYNNKIILYGCGDCGKRAIRLLGDLEIPILGLCDSDEEKWGKTVEGYEVISVQELKERVEDGCIIIIAIANPRRVEEVLERLNNYGIFDVNCYTYLGLKYAIELHIDDQRIKESYRKKYNIARRAFLEYKYLILESMIKEFIWSSLLYDMVLIYSPAKVGTTTIEEGLREAHIRHFKMHHVAKSWCAGESAYEKPAGIELINNLKKIRIISLVREPIARGISAYFHGFEIDGYYRYENINQDIYQIINDNLGQETKVGKFGWLFEWFHQEMEKVFGIDIYQYNFDKEKGYQIIREGNIELMLIKCEKLNECQKDINQFLGCKNFALKEANAGNEKPYRFAYAELKSTIKIPEYIMDFYYKENKAMNHFYTDEEKEVFRNKWMEN